MGLYKQIGYRNISLSSGDITNSLLKTLNAENGLDLKALTARLSISEQEALETNLIRGVIEKFTKDGITDFSKVSNTLKNAPFESKRAVEIMSELNKKAPILNNTSSLLEKLTAINPKAKELQQGIGHSVTGALMTMKRNLAIERLKSLLPVLGNDAALKNHIRNAINNAGDLKSVINNLEKVEIKDAPQNSQKLLEAFKNEVKALRDEAQTGEIKGENFITKESPAPKSDLSVRINNGAYRQHSMIRPNEPSIWQGDLKNDYTQIVKNIASDRNIALRLDPSADVLAIVKDFSQPIKTPIFTSKISVDKMLNHLADKADGERRLEYINLVKPTLENPLFITQETINGAQRFRFFKTFIDEKDKVIKFLNVVEDKNGELLEITAMPIKNTDLKNLLKGKIVWGGDALSDLSSPRTAKRGSEADATIISQKGNLINEKAKNSTLPNGVSGIGDNGKLGKIGIQKDYDSEYLKLNHATYSSKADKENKRLLRRNENSHLVGSPTPTQLTLGKATEPTADGAKALLDEKELKVGTPYPTLQCADVNQVGPTAGAKSTFSSSDESIIPQKDKSTKTINASPHIASGLLGGTANGTDENGNISPEEFAKGFIYALFGSKITAEGVKRASPELYNKILSISNKPSEEVKKIVDNIGADKIAKQEKRGIYNVTYNGKFLTPVYKDLEDVEGAVRYAIGNKNKGAKHIEIKHLEDTTKEGYVTKQELLNMGENMRKFIKKYKEPFINDRKARLYEWEDKDGVRFRLVINDIKDKNGGSGIHSAITSTSANDDIITFYSDRNLKEPMKFENPKLKLLDAIDNSSDKVGAVEKILLNKHISDGAKAKAVNRLTKNKISQVIKNNCILVLVFL